MLITAGILSLLTWGYLVLFRGQFWRIRSAPSPLAPETAARIAVVIPARNEADVVGRTITSLLRQGGSNTIHIFLVDDASSDGTAQAARDAALNAERPDLLTVIEGCSLPPGWSGKLWAMQQGVELASTTHPDFFLFTDADIVHAPDSVSSLVAIAQSDSRDLVSFMVKLHCQTLAEKLLIPAFVYFFFKLYPPAWVADPRRATAGAAGGCILVRPEVLERAGGISAIRHEVIDDCALASRVKRRGGRIWLGSSNVTESIRPYGNFSEIGRMISRSAFNQLHHSAALLVLAIVGMAMIYLFPPLLVSSYSTLPTVLGAAAWLLMMASYQPILRWYRLSPLWALALPFIATFYVGATVHSAWKYWTGRGGEWKGRIQDPVTITIDKQRS